MPTVFIIDDEEAIRTLVAYNFERSGFLVETCADGQEGYQRLLEKSGAYDLVVLDLMLAGMDGLDICKKLRQAGVTIPIILLTAKDDEVDMVLGLEIGADDYVTKPFSPRELIARARAVLRRTETPLAQADDDANSRILAVGELVMDLHRHEVSIRGEGISLTPKEFHLLRHMMEQRGTVLSRDTLLDRVWGYSVAMDTRIVDVHVSHLRDKIELDPKNPEYIRTVRGVGYKLAPRSSDQEKNTSNRDSFTNSLQKNNESFK